MPVGLPGRALIAIPARFASSRLPGKALLDLEGKTMIRRVAESMLAVPGAEVVVVTDDARIARSAAEAGAATFLSRRPAASGSDRIRHYLEDAGRAWPGIVVNAQGDEPLLGPGPVGSLLARLGEAPAVGSVTLLRALEPGEVADPHVVKAALLPDGRIEDFARLPSDEAPRVGSETDLECPRRHRWLAHVGVYAFRAETFRTFTDLPASSRERRERLEQLRLLEKGIPIHGVTTAERPIAVDTPADAERVRAALRGAPAVARV